MAPWLPPNITSALDVLQYSLPYFAPRGVPADRAENLRIAFMAAVPDPDLQKMAQKARLEVNPLAGSEVAALIADIYANVSPAAVRRTRSRIY
jgi:tripartite-type tricarboxylate transporter receptor subunit TctC